MGGLRREGLLHNGSLTAQGERRAEELIRAHRLWERYLVDEGGVSGEDVHDEAERLEHVATVAMADRLDEVLGSPRSDPHGKPIPPRGGRWAALHGRSLSDLQPGESGRVLALREESAEGLRLLADLGLLPTSPVEVVSRDEASLLVRTNGEPNRIDLALAGDVLVGDDARSTDG
ncbi:MAG: FeoA domain-containing protein [Gemmatimonadota bacterium]|nr:FeoA domain-containing protein [Gemmatimonadota bacterium]